MYIVCTSNEIYVQKRDSKKKRWKEFQALLSKGGNTESIYSYFSPSKYYYYSEKLGKKATIHEKRLVNKLWKIHIF